MEDFKTIYEQDYSEFKPLLGDNLADNMKRAFDEWVHFKLEADIIFYFF